jgi:hypothetical protein
VSGDALNGASRMISASSRKKVMFLRLLQQRSTTKRAGFLADQEDLSNARHMRPAVLEVQSSPMFISILMYLVCNSKRNRFSYNTLRENI